MILANKFPNQEIKNRLKNLVSNSQQDIKWPDVTVHTKVEKYSANVPESSYSILSINNDGLARMLFKNRELKISKDTFLLLSPFQTFEYIIDQDLPIEVLNFHLGFESYQNVISALTKDQEKLLDNPLNFEGSELVFNHIHFKSEMCKQLLNNYSSLDNEDHILNVVNYSLKLNKDNHQIFRNIQSIRSSTKKELVRRMFLARDIIYSKYDDSNLNLEYLSTEVFMSKFHFLRIFKQTFGITPYQMIRDIRMRKIVEMTSQNNNDIMEISTKVGLREPNSVYALLKEALNLGLQSAT